MAGTQREGLHRRRDNGQDNRTRFGSLVSRTKEYRLAAAKIQHRRLAANADGGQCHRLSLRGAAYHLADLQVTWGKLWQLKTHSAGGITDKDFEMAKKIEDVVLWRPGGGNSVRAIPSHLSFTKVKLH